MIKIKLFIMILLVVFLVGCSADIGSSGGTVTNIKKYMQQYNECENYDVILICDTVVYGGYAYVIWVENHWWKNTFSTTEEIYNSCEIGDTYYSTGCVK